MGKRLLCLLLCLIMSISLFPATIYADNGGGGSDVESEKNQGGHWLHSKQGYRISILNSKNEVMGTPVDIRYSTPPGNPDPKAKVVYIWDVKTEPFMSRKTPNKVIMMDDMLSHLRLSKDYDKIKPLSDKDTGQGKYFRKWFGKTYINDAGETVEGGFGHIDEVLNYRPDGVTPIFEFNSHDADYTEMKYPDGEYAGQIDVSSTAMASGYRIFVENLTFIEPRSHSTGKHYSYYLYGTISNINAYVNKLMQGGDKDFTRDGKGVVWYRYHIYMNEGLVHALQLDHTDVSDWGTIWGGTTSPMKDYSVQVSIGDSADNTQGYSLHIYEGSKPDKTHTYDQISFPLNNYKEGPAPDTGEKSKYQIVKFYEQLVHEEDDIRDKEAEFEHIVTYERVKTYPKIKIEDEPNHEHPEYTVIEWKWSDQEKPDITPDLKWTDEPIASIPALDGRCGDKCTENLPLDKQYIC